MTSIERITIIAVGTAFSIILAGIAIKDYVQRDDDLPTCVAGQDEICPSAAWTRTYRKQMELQNALQAGIPGGYFYNGQGKFVKPPKPAAQAPAAQSPEKK